MTELSVIVPVFNEENSIQPFLDRLLPVLRKATSSFEVLFCLDPSTDNTKKVILDLAKKHHSLKLISFSRRFGQAAATFAGISKAQGEYLVTIDVDLQDPPEVIELMLEAAKKGYDVIYTKRLSRQGESYLKCLIARLGYYMMSKLSNGLIQKECGDFRLFSRRVAKHLLNLKERHIFLRAQIPMIGFPSTTITYHRDPRLKGEGHYNRYWGSIKMGLDGIFCFSARPLNLIFMTALLLFIPTTLWLFKQCFHALLSQKIASNSQLIIAAMCEFSAINLFAMSLIAEYIARIYTETQARPRFIIETNDITNNEQ